jgi:hypothetical protein
MSAPSFPAVTTGFLTIHPWPDDVIDSLGHDPRSTYVETYWLCILGPSTTWLLRRLVNGLDVHPEGYELPLADTARSLGLGDKGGRHSPFVRALTRLVQFDLAQPQGPRLLAVRRRVPPLNRRQIQRLPASLQAEHQRLLDTNLRTPAAEQQRRRSRQLALSLFELGESRDAVERQLLTWRYHPIMARDAASWAWDRHRRADELTQVGGAGPSSERPSTSPDAA